ncbi:hypothetical protein AAG570_006282 [Ranatra chinensis]|uniref:Uncharacterized protein n=1 Tax=Ranatra chinensis TaxID=642074 RepID=A0ABD0YU68_9HEMI
METLEDVAATADTTAANTGVILDSIKTKIMMIMEVIKGVPVFDGSTVDLEEFSYLLVTANAQLAAASQMLGEVRWQNLYNMLIWYAGARHPVARVTAKLIRMQGETGETPQHFAHRMDAELRSLKDRAIEESGSAAARIQCYTEIARGALMLEKVCRQLRVTPPSLMEVVLIAIDEDEDKVQAMREWQSEKTEHGQKVLTVIDRLTRFAFAHLLTNKAAGNVCEGLLAFFRTVGLPGVLVINQGRDTRNTRVTALLKEFKQVTTTTLEAVAPTLDHMTMAQLAVNIITLMPIFDDNPGDLEEWLTAAAQAGAHLEAIESSKGH